MKISSLFNEKKTHSFFDSSQPLNFDQKLHNFVATALYLPNFHVEQYDLIDPVTFHRKRVTHAAPSFNLKAIPQLTIKLIKLLFKTILIASIIFPFLCLKMRSPSASKQSWNHLKQLSEQLPSDQMIPFLHAIRSGDILRLRNHSDLHRLACNYIDSGLQEKLISFIRYSNKFATYIAENDRDREAKDRRVDFLADSFTDPRGKEIFFYPYEIQICFFGLNLNPINEKSYSIEMIKKEALKLLVKLHPDRNPTGAEKYKRIQQYRSYLVKYLNDHHMIHIPDSSIMSSGLGKLAISGADQEVALPESLLEDD
ncbi:MAG: hypothetical protein ACHQUC_05285 [Chlamydiales bacterium]